MNFVSHAYFKLMFNTFTAKLFFSGHIMNAKIWGMEKMKIPI